MGAAACCCTERPLPKEVDKNQVVKFGQIPTGVITKENLKKNKSTYLPNVVKLQETFDEDYFNVTIPLNKPRRSSFNSQKSGRSTS